MGYNYNYNYYHSSIPATKPPVGGVFHYFQDSIAWGL